MKTPHHWHYPNPRHPATRDFPRSSQNREVLCPHCGAPPNASCITRHGNPRDGEHKARVQLRWGIS